MYHRKDTRMLVLLDVMHENYVERKREQRQAMQNGGKAVTSHFSVREDDEQDYELFDEGDPDDELYRPRRKRDEDDE